MKIMERLRNKEIFQDGKFVQILILSFSFMLLFTAFQTTSFIEQTVLTSVRAEDPTFSGSGYVSLCIIYAVFALGSWVAPSLVAVLRPKWSMIFSALIYVVFIAQFNYPTTWVLYLTSALLGGGASLLWCAQGNFLTLASCGKTISRNSGVFWAINQCSLFFGNLFVFYQFYGKTVIDSETRIFVFIVLTVVAALGVGSLLVLKDLRENSPQNDQGGEGGESRTSSEIRLPEADSSSSSCEGTPSSTSTPMKPQPPPASTNLQLATSALTQAAKLFITPYMLLLSMASIYTGWGQCFFFGVYSTAVGATLKFDDPKKLVGLIGIFTGIGEVLGGTVFGLLGSKTTKKGRSPVVFLGLLIHTLCYILIYLNLPNSSPLGETSETSIINPPKAWLAVGSALLLGFGDACYQTQLFSIFGSVYSDKSAAAFAIFKFTQSAASSIAFFGSDYMGILAQMVVLFVTAVLGFLGVLIVEVDTNKKKKEMEKVMMSSQNGQNLRTSEGERDGGVGEDLEKHDLNRNDTSNNSANTNTPPVNIMITPAAESENSSSSGIDDNNAKV